ncbi:MAG: hypothetical protein PHC51_04480 [bacterium]|nr:hypothetical protein [bacterium]
MSGRLHKKTDAYQEPSGHKGATRRAISITGFMSKTPVCFADEVLNVLVGELLEGAMKIIFATTT